MKNLIAIVLKPIADFLVWHYKAIDKLRPDDTANQVMLLNLILHGIEAGCVYVAYLVFGKVIFGVM